MKKNGFTLVEVLTTITIIGLLLLIAVPSITRILEKSREDSFNKQVGFLLEAGENYFIEKILTDPDSIDWQSMTVLGIDINYATVTLGTLINSGNIRMITDPKSGTDCNTSDSFVEVIKHSETKYTYSVSGVCENYSYDDTTSKDMDCIDVSVNSGYVDADLEYFPLTLNFNNSHGTDDIFSEIQNDYQKMKVYFVDSLEVVSEMYVEVESWDKDAGTGGEATIHVSHPDFIVSSSENTPISICYASTFVDNDTYIGGIGSDAGKLVWGNDYTLVMHMTGVTGDDDLVDSSSNGLVPSQINGVKAAGINGDSRLYDGGADTRFLTESAASQVLNSADIEFSATVLLKGNGIDLAKSKYPFGIYNNEGWDVGSDGYPDETWNWEMVVPSANSTLIFAASAHDGGESTNVYNYTAPPLTTIDYDDNWKVWVTSKKHDESTGADLNIYRNGDLFNNAVKTPSYPFYDSTIVVIGKYYTGWIDEVRCATNVRTAAWHKAEYHALIGNLINH